MRKGLKVAAAVVLLAVGLARGEGRLKTENVIWVTLDGVRWQEVFGGADEGLLNKEHRGVADVAGVRRSFWRETAGERRAALMPFLWGTVARDGQVFGNREKGSVARVTNDQWFSYPGYNEIFTGFADPRIKSNDKVENENVTVLEWLHRKPEFAGRVAAFAGWDVMPFIINEGRCGFPVMGGWEPVPDREPNERQAMLNELIAQTTPTVDSELYDAFLYQAAAEHLKRHRPRVLVVCFSETDSWAHAGRYDRVLQTAYFADSFVGRLWEAAQSMEQYRGKTTLVVTTDHGRGGGPVQWKSHARNVPGSSAIWVAVMGPDTPALGERGEGPEVTQGQVAATVARLLGEDYRKAEPRAGEAIEAAFPGAPSAKQ
jgi:hypothetical protein